MTELLIFSETMCLFVMSEKNLFVKNSSSDHESRARNQEVAIQQKLHLNRWNMTFDKKI